MNARILPPEEYGKLIGTEAEGAVPYFTVATRVVVIEQDAAILACHVLQPVLHAECLWVRPDHRGHGGVLRALWKADCAAVRDEFQTAAFFTAAEAPDVVRLLERLGAVKFACDHYMVRVPCQR